MTKRAVICSVAALAIVLAACGGDDAESSATTSPAATTGGEATTTTVGSDTSTTAAGGDATTTTAAPSAQSPVVIEHRFGSTTIDEPPTRIVSLDGQWTDVLGALEAPVAGALFNPFGPGRAPWQADILPDTELLTASQEAGLPFEAIAALEPDLIVTSWEAQDQAAYDRLSSIAPTIPQLSEKGVDAWQDMAAVAGRFLGDEQAAADLVEAGEQQVADLRAELPGLAGKTYALANYVVGQGIWIVAEPGDGADVVFSQLGMEILPGVLALPGLEDGRVQVSVEEIQVIDADLLVLLTNGTDPASIPGYAGLSAVQRGAVALLDTVDVSALNTPSPLSVPYALDLIRPALEAAAR